MASVIAKFKQDPSSTIKYTIRWGAPAWQASTPYVVDDCVFDAQYKKYHRCIEQHTSDPSDIDTDINNGFWKWEKEGFWLNGLTAENINGATPEWVVPVPLVKASQSQDSYTATVVIEGGAGTPTDPPTQYDVSCKVTTDQTPAEIVERSIGIVLVER